MNLQTFAIVAACLVVIALGLVANFHFHLVDRIFKRPKKQRLAFIGLGGAVAVFCAGFMFSVGLLSLHALLTIASAAAVGVPFMFGAVTVTPVTAPAGQNPLRDTFIAQIAATADADVTATITHNFGLAAAQQPFTEVEITMMQAPIAAASPNWAVTARGANTITMTKNASVGTGLVGNQVEVRVRRPHTLGL